MNDDVILFAAPEKPEVIGRRGYVALGIDVGRRHDSTVLQGWEQASEDEPAFLRQVIVLRNVPFDEQESAVRAFMNLRNPDAIAIDETGIGMQMAEELTYGRAVSAVRSSLTREQLDSLADPRVMRMSFTEQSKAELVGVAYDYLTSDRVRVPQKYRQVLEEFANIRKQASAAGRLVFRDDPHGDLAWAAMLALWALRRLFYSGGAGIVSYAT